MQVYLAPMEGITGSIVRNAFYHNFGCIDKYFTPFIPAAKRLNPRQIRDLLPENNKGIYLVPQLISNQSCEVLEMINILKGYGYSEFNINLGCPSGTVTSKKRGSGMLKYPEDLDRFLNGIYSYTDCPVSVKTRIGFDDISEWPEILDIYSQYPISELIIHPRLRREMYSGFVHLTEYAMVYDRAASATAPAASENGPTAGYVPAKVSTSPFSSNDGPTAGNVPANANVSARNLQFRPQALCYNGDIWDMECYNNVISRFPETPAVMIGRGLLSRPDLACLIKGTPPADTKKRLRDFCNEIYEGYLSIFSSPRDAVGHMKEIWTHLGRSFEHSEKLMKKLMKNQDPHIYSSLTDQIFETLELADRN